MRNGIALRQRSWKAVTSAIMIAGFVAATTTPAYSDGGAVLATADGSVTAAEIAEAATAREKIHDLLASGLTIREIANRLGLTVVSDGADDASPMSAQSDAWIGNPWVVFDPHTSGGVYQSGSSFGWNNTQWRHDCPTSANCGGKDGIGLRISEAAQMIGASATVSWVKYCPSTCKTTCFFPCPLQMTNPSDFSQYGATFEYQDRTIADLCANGQSGCRNYQGSGNVILTFKKLSGGCHQLFSVYHHNWSSTGITSFTVSPSGFNLTFSPTSHGWNKFASQPGETGC